MSVAALSPGEFASLVEVGGGAFHAPILLAHEIRLLELKLVYNLLGNLRITAAGRTRIALGN